VNLLAACAEVAQWWTSGVRHSLALAFAGICKKEGLEPNLVIQIIIRICSLTNDFEGKDRINAIKSTFSKPTTQAQGYKGLVSIVGSEVADRISTRLRAFCGYFSETNVSSTPLHDGTIIDGASFVDCSELTEARVGAALSTWMEGKAVFVCDTKQWMIWNGLYWQFDQKNLILQLAYQFINEVKADLMQQGKYSDANNMRAFESRRKLENIVLLASITRAVVKADFDTDPFMVAANNLWIDLKTGKSVAPDPHVLVSKVLTAPYDAEAKCPQFIHFLNQVFENNEELIRFVQKAIGYSLTGSTQEQCFFIMIGDGANGKSTFINLINGLWGSYGTTAASQTLIANGRGSSIGDDLVDLVCARIISVSETEEGQSLAEAKIKQMTGGDTLKGRPLYGMHLQFEIIGKLWLGTNSLPQINNTDFGIWRRIMAIPFHKTFAPHEQDKTLRQKLQAELPGILAWAVEGCLAWQHEGLVPPTIVEDQTRDYRTAMDSIAQWVQDQCCINAEQSYPASSLYGEYRSWCLSSGRKPQSTASFKRSLERLRGGPAFSTRMQPS
jgi:putative DNA primase/helicase